MLALVLLISPYCRRMAPLLPVSMPSLARLCCSDLAATNKHQVSGTDVTSYGSSKKERKKRKVTLLGVRTGASRPRGSPRGSSNRTGLIHVLWQVQHHSLPANVQQHMCIRSVAQM